MAAAELGVFPSSLAPALSSPSLGHLTLVKFEFGDGEGGTVTRRFHPGVGTFVDGSDNEWEGITDPGGIRAVSIGAVELPQVNVAAKVDITLSGVDREFLSALRQEIHNVYTAPAEIYIQIIDPDTYELIGDPVLVFDNGVCGVPVFTATRKGVRSISISIDGIWSNKNFAPGGHMNSASQRARYPGDLGADLIGSTAYERIK